MSFGNPVQSGGLVNADIDTSLELKTILTDETGSGLAVFATGPTLSQPTAPGAGAGSEAWGASAVAAGAAGTALGNAASAGSTDSVAIGETAAASVGTGAIAIGSDAVASNTAAIALGDGAVSSNTQTIAIGFSADATAADAIAIGENAQAVTGSANISIGSDASASGTTGAIAIGDGAASVGASGIGLGRLSRGAASGSIGIGNSAGGDGTLSIAIGQDAAATPTDSIAIGESATTTNGTGNIAIGSDAQALGTVGAIALGDGAVVTAGATSGIAIGTGTVTGAFANSFALGVSAACTAANDGQIGTAAVPYNLKTYGTHRMNTQAMTAGTMTGTVTAEVRDVIHQFSWTNAMVVALGATTTGNIAICTLPAKTVVLNAYVVITGAAAGPASVTVSVGRAAASYIDYIVASDAKAAANTVYGDGSAERGTNLTGYDLASYTGTTVVNAQFVSVGANLDTVTASTGHVYLETMVLP